MAGRYFLLSCDLFVWLGNLSVWKLTGSREKIRTEVAKLYFPAADDGPMWFEVTRKTWLRNCAVLSLMDHPT